MSRLIERLEELSAPKLPSNITDWLDSLSSEDKDAAWAALMNPMLKNYTLLGIFREEGMKASKETFIPFRKDVLGGTIKRTDTE